MDESESLETMQSDSFFGKSHNRQMDELNETHSHQKDSLQNKFLNCL